MRRTRIDLLSPPFAGHLHPILGMAGALKSCHEVRVITTPGAGERVRASGIEAVAMLAGWEERLEAIINTPKAIGSNPWRLFKQLSQTLEIHRQVRTELEHLYRASRPDLVIADFTLIAVGPVASELGIHWWTSLPSPCVLDGGNGPPCYLGGLRPMAGCIGWLRDRLGWATIHGFKHLVARVFREDFRRIGLDSLYRKDGSETIYSQEAILALGWPELEFRSAWPSSVGFIPPFLHCPPVQGRPPRFASGKRHVLVTLGTHLRWIKDRFASDLEGLALRTPQVEYHFSDGDAAGELYQDRGNFQRLPYIDYRLVGRYDLVVHHAGAGILAHCLTQGCPAVVFPIDFDQFDNAARLEYAGLAHRLRHLKGLPQAVEAALSDTNMRERCRQFARDHDPIQAQSVLRARVDSLLGETAADEAR